MYFSFDRTAPQLMSYTFLAVCVVLGCLGGSGFSWPPCMPGSIRGGWCTAAGERSGNLTFMDLLWGLVLVRPCLAFRKKLGPKGGWVPGRKRFLGEVPLWWSAHKRAALAPKGMGRRPVHRGDSVQTSAPIRHDSTCQLFWWHCSLRTIFSA